MDIKVTGIVKKDNRIDVMFTYSQELNAFFNNKEFFVEYSESIEDVPDAIAVIPFVTNVLPIVWLFDATLYVQELDKTFFDCIDSVKAGYIKMYPEAEFKGEVLPERLVDCTYETSGKKTLFFSGGLDAVHSLIRHIDEKPDLITIWGSDLRLTDIDGWNEVKKAVYEIGKKLDLKNVFIKSSFAEFIEERKLSYKFMDVIHGFWYHNIQHGIGMLGLISPYAYKYKIKMHYIASSYCIKHHHIECASDPSIDNELKFGNCTIFHDAFECSRQDKTKDICNYCRNNYIRLTLRVCWSVKDGKNCCSCEKCYRTICGLIAEGENPKSYGFTDDKNTLLNMVKYMTLYYQTNGVTKDFWKDIQKRVIENKKILKAKSPFYPYVEWMINFDFDDIKKNRPYIINRIKSNLSNALCRIIPRKVKDTLKRFL